MTRHSKLTVEKLMENLEARDAMDNAFQKARSLEDLATENAILKRLLVDALVKKEQMKSLLDSGTSVEQGCDGRGGDTAQGNQDDELYFVFKDDDIWNDPPR
jgi:hypothetical protein